MFLYFDLVNKCNLGKKENEQTNNKINNNNKKNILINPKLFNKTVIVNCNSFMEIRINCFHTLSNAKGKVADISEFGKML